MKPTKSINVEFAKRVALAYHEMKHEPKRLMVRRAYSMLAIETVDQYENILSSGLKVEFEGKIPLYLEPADAIRDIYRNNHLFVTPTFRNFGSNDDFKPDANPLLNHSGFRISGQPACINDLFRAIHDYFGHYKGGNGFRALGEENAYRYHCGMFSPLAQKALTTETRGQNSWLNYGPHGEHNRNASQAQTIYADQKTGLLPDFCMEEY